jgi:SNF family Na+-dependent transporter
MEPSGYAGDRDRWGTGQGKDLKHRRLMFICGSIGAAIGLGNMWKFPNLTFKHGGIAFIIIYVIVLLIAGMPMLLLEFTLGQKMQRGSAGAMRGITPRLAGVGWVASFCGFVVCLIYNMLLSLTFYYMLFSSGMPWTEANWRDGVRPQSCTTAAKMSLSSAQLYLYIDVTKMIQEETCDGYDDGLDQPMFNVNMVGGMVLMWVICFAVLYKGVKTFQYITAILVPLTFVFLIILIILYLGLSGSKGGNAAGFYIGGQSMAGLIDE